MKPALTQDARETKLPQWTQQLLSDLRRELAAQERRAERAEAKVETYTERSQQWADAMAAVAAGTLDSQTVLARVQEGKSPDAT